MVRPLAVVGGALGVLATFVLGLRCEPIARAQEASETGDASTVEAAAPELTPPASPAEHPPIDAERKYPHVEKNQWIALGVTVPIGVRLEVVRVRWRYFQLSVASGGYRMPDFKHAFDPDYKPLLWGGLGGLGAKFNFWDRDAYEIGFLVFPISVGSAQVGPGRFGDQQAGVFFTNVYAARRLGSFRGELGLEGPALWIGGTSDALGPFGGAPPWCFHFSVGY